MARTSTARRVGAGAVVLALVASGVVFVFSRRHHKPPAPSCAVTSATGSTTYPLDVDQAANAATIAAIGKKLGLPDHAVTVALAAALQESQLHNLAYGDRDSLGLFQQRPSQGWGTSSEILTPSYAAAAFFRELVKVDNWPTLPVTQAAQEVQRSGAPTAYAQWENEARSLAVALTGERAERLTCRFALTRSSDLPPSFTNTMRNELGVDSLDTPFGPAKGWAVASWLVANAQKYRITRVSFLGREWRASSGKWRSANPADRLIRVRQDPPGA
jgi:hypothetical protein